MELKYAASKPLLSAKGVQFDHRKRDKFIYLNFVAELIVALDHPYESNQFYCHDISSNLWDSERLLALFEAHNPGIRSEIEEWRQKTVDEIETEIGRVYASRFLGEEEKEVFANNIEMTRGERIQRTINKTAYYSGVNTLADIIRREHIAFVTASILPVHFHIFHSIQGVLSQHRPFKESTIDIYEEGGILYTRLSIAL